MRLYLRAVSHTFLILRSTACLSSSPVLRFHTQSCLVNTTMPTALDVLIIGGGPGGLAVATGLARQLYTAVDFDTGVYRTDNVRFEATDARGTTWTGKKLVLASGMRDIYPDIPGYDDVWGRGV